MVHFVAIGIVYGFSELNIGVIEDWKQGFCVFLGKGVNVGGLNDDIF